MASGCAGETRSARTEMREQGSRGVKGGEIRRSGDGWGFSWRPWAPPDRAVRLEACPCPVPMLSSAPCICICICALGVNGWMRARRGRAEHTKCTCPPLIALCGDERRRGGPGRDMEQRVQLGLRRSAPSADSLTGMGGLYGTCAGAGATGGDSGRMGARCQVVPWYCAHAHAHAHMADGDNRIPRALLGL